MSMGAIIVGLLAFTVGYVVGRINGWNDCYETLEERQKMLRILNRKMTSGLPSADEQGERK